MDILSNLNKNIISWYSIKESDTVLQIGENESIFNEIKNKTKNVTVISEKERNVSQKYDFVLVIGAFEKLDMEKEIVELLEFAKNQLSPKGKILLAMQNKFGMKYWTGEKVSEESNPYDSLVQNMQNILSLPKIKGILDDLKLKYKFYYPLPDYKMTNVIYTDEFMPDDESIDSRVLTIFKQDAVVNFSEREAYKQLLHENKSLFPFFVNSYFIEISSVEDFEPIRYVNFEIYRKPEYDIKTVMEKDFVYKTPNNKEAFSHIDRIKNNIKILNEKSIKTLDSFDDKKIISKYAKNGIMLEDYIVQKYKQNGKQTAIDLIQKFKTEILDKFEHIDYQENNVFRKYGIKDETVKDLHYIKNGIIDLRAQNCFVIDNEYYVYDQEWYEENVPIEFLLYRFVYYNSQLDEYISKDELYEIFGVSAYLDIFKELDIAIFQNLMNDEIMVKHNVSMANIGGIYRELDSLKENIELSKNHISNLENTIEKSKDHISNLENTIEKSKDHISNLENTIETSQNHISNLEDLIENYKDEIQNRDIEIKNRNEEISKKQKLIEDYETGIQDLRQGINNLTYQVQEKDAQIVDYANQLRTISNSLSWKLTKPIRMASWVLNPFNGASLLDRIMPPGGQRRIEYDRKQTEKKYAKKVEGYFNLSDEETAEYWKLIDHGKNLKYQKDLEKQASDELTDYEKWMMANQVSNEELEQQTKKRFRRKPKISIVVPLYKTKTVFFRELLYTLHCQTYSNWELCLADGSPEPLEEIQKMCEKDKRIKYKFLGSNDGISSNSNAALELVTGDYIGLLDHDDFLEENCLYEIVKCINENPKVEFIYTDEDKATGLLDERFDAYFKSDFAPDTLLSQNYICHFSVFKKSVMDKLGGFRKEFDGAQDYDIFLRMSEIVKPENIKHIAKVLYHWRMHKESTAMEAEAKPWAFDAGRRAIADHLERMGIDAIVNDGKAIGTYEVEYPVKGNPKVSIVIPNKDGIDVLKVCVDSILEKTTYDNYEIVIVENNSTEKETFTYYDEIKKNEKVEVIYYPDKGFNYSRIINFGVRNCDGDFVMQLNNDTEVVTPDWLEKMIGYAQRKEIGAVGVRLNYPDDTIQHAGVLLGLGGIAGHLHKNIHKDAYGYFSRAVMIQDMTAVTAACIMTRREIYDEVGFMNEKLAVAFNDIDFCMKIRKAGYFIIYNPFVELWHYESKTRGEEDSPEKVKRFNGEIETFRAAWQKELDAGDPYYNKNLRLDNDQYEVRTEKVGD